MQDTHGKFYQNQPSFTVNVTKRLGLLFIGIRYCSSYKHDFQVLQGSPETLIM